MDEIKGRSDLELHCDGILSFLSKFSEKLITGQLPDGTNFKNIDTQEEGNKLYACLDDVISECSKNDVGSFLRMNGSLSEKMFWQKGNPPPLRGPDINTLFPYGKDEVLQDFLFHIQKQLCIKHSNMQLNKEDMLHNSDLISDFENLIGWIYLLNRQVLNKLFFEFDPSGDFCTDMNELIKSTNVLERHGKSKKHYNPLI